LGEPVLGELAGSLRRLEEPARAEIAKWLKGYKGEAAALRTALGVSARTEKGFLNFKR
jgi:hypothetical protein